MSMSKQAREIFMLLALEDAGMQWIVRLRTGKLVACRAMPFRYKDEQSGKMHWYCSVGKRVQVFCGGFLDEINTDADDPANIRELIKQKCGESPVKYFREITDKMSRELNQICGFDDWSEC